MIAMVVNITYSLAHDWVDTPQIIVFLTYTCIENVGSQGCINTIQTYKKLSSQR